MAPALSFSANILVATKKDFETQNRKKFCSRIATGDYDAIIIGHSQFEKIPHELWSASRPFWSARSRKSWKASQQAKAQKAERYTVKQMERTRKSLEAKAGQAQSTRAARMMWSHLSSLGVDRLFIDESHYFKNLFLATKMRNVGWHCPAPKPRNPAICS